MSKTITEIGLFVAGMVLTAVGTMVPGAQFAIGIGVSLMLTGIGMALRPNPNSVNTPNTISFDNGVSPRRVIYGQTQTAGVLTFAAFPSSSNLDPTAQYLHLVYTLAAHEISSFDAVVIDGMIYNFADDLIFNPTGVDNLWHVKPGNVSAIDDFYWEHVFFEFDFGRNNSNPPFPNLEAAGCGWTYQCIQQNCAKVAVILRADANWTALFPAGQIPNIQFLVTGKKLIDPRIVTAWAPSTGYVEYNYIVDNRGVVWVQTNASGTSGILSARPNFETGGFFGWPATLADNTCSWTSPGYAQGQISGDWLGYGDSDPQGHIVNGVLVNDGWSPSASFALGRIIEAPLGYLQQATVLGTSGTSEPAFALTAGANTTDNAQTWLCLGRSWNAINPSNNALIVNDYLQNTDFGMAAPLATVDLSSVIGAANICEEQVLIVWNVDNTVVYENLYACNGMFDFSSTRGDVLSSLLASMAGYAIPPGDLWHVAAGSFQTPTIALGDSDMRGAIKGDFRLSRRDVCNSVKGQFQPAFIPANPAAVVSMTQMPGIWRQQSFPAYQANGLAGKPNYLNSEDGGQIIWLELRLDFTTSIWMAQRLAKIAMMRTRFQQLLTLAAKTAALELEAGDTFSFTHLRWNILGQTFETIQALVMTGESGGEHEGPALGVDLVARQTDPSIYVFTAPTSAANFGEYSPYAITGIMTGVE